MNRVARFLVWLLISCLLVPFSTPVLRLANAEIIQYEVDDLVEEVESASGQLRINQNRPRAIDPRHVIIGVQESRRIPAIAFSEPTFALIGHRLARDLLAPARC